MITSNTIKGFTLIPLLISALLSYSPNTELGSATYVYDRTLFVTILLSTEDTCFSDIESSKEEILGNMTMADSYIKECVMAYNQDTDFVYNFSENSDLIYKASADCRASSLNDETIVNIIIKDIPTNHLLKKYEADSIAYTFCVNTPESFNKSSWTFAKEDGDTNTYEFSCIYLGNLGYKECPANYAHEILHLFGAIDMYCENEKQGITSKDLDVFKEKYPNDIMLTTDDSNLGKRIYDSISNSFSDYDAKMLKLICP